MKLKTLFVFSCLIFVVASSVTACNADRGRHRHRPTPDVAVIKCYLKKTAS